MLNVIQNPGESIKEYIGKFGTDVSYSRLGTEYTPIYKAIIQPLRYKNKMYLNGTNSPIGHVDQSYYLYIGPYDVDVCSQSISANIKVNNKPFCFTRAEKVEISGQVIYYWAVIRAYNE